MLLNASKVIEKDFSTNVCIIGSGIGGGTLIKKLSDKGEDFIVIEAGGLKRQKRSDVIMDNIGLDFGIRNTRAIMLGGTSNLWHGVLSTLDSIDFEKRSWIPHSGWPIKLNDLMPYYMEASELFGVEKYKDFKLNTLSGDLKKNLKIMSFDRKWLKNKIFQQPLPPLNFKNLIKSIVKNSSQQHCLYNAVALELITDEYGKKVQKLLVGVPGGKTFFVIARQFVICAGALETPRILLNSSKVNFNGLGNEGDNVGRYLMDHPMGNLCQVEFRRKHKAPIYSDIKYSKQMKIRTGLELNDEMQRKYQLPNHNTFMRVSFVKGIHDETEKVKLSLLAFRDGGVSFKDVWKVITNFNVSMQILAYKFSLNVTYKYADLFFVTEQIPNPNSRVTLSIKKDRFGYPIAKVNWQITDRDLGTMKKWYKLLREIMLSEDDYIFTHKIDDLDWENIFTSAAHHVGTAKMAENVKEGVVDKNLKVFDVENLFICDGSVFSTSGNVNNGLTISALACRLAQHLKFLTD